LILKLYGLRLSTAMNQLRFTAHFLDQPYEFVIVNLPHGKHLQPG
jgi:hypothetical protein